jgi:hypothetical protein
MITKQGKNYFTELPGKRKGIQPCVKKSLGFALRNILTLKIIFISPPLAQNPLKRNPGLLITVDYFR